MKQFSVEEYNKNPKRKVVTRKGEDVRIVCTDRKGTDFPIIALCGGVTTGQEICRIYHANGNFSETGTTEFDLVFAEEYNKSINTVQTAFLEKANVEFKTKLMTARYVARYAIDNMFKGKYMILPGGNNKMIRFLSKIVPDTIIGKIVYNMEKAKR